MKRLPKQVIADLGVDAPCPTDIKVIDAWSAIAFVAFGAFSPPEHSSPVQSWIFFLKEDNWQHDRDSGRIDLASDLVTEAIKSGRLQCVIIDESEARRTWDNKGLARLSVIPREQFNNVSVSHDQDVDFYLSLVDEEWDREAHTDDPDETDSLNIEGFCFFWDEVAALRPQSSVPHLGLGTGDMPRPTPPIVMSRAVAPVRDERRGRAPKRHGAPIAAFLAKALAHDLAEKLTEKDEHLGQLLIEEYRSRGIDPPHWRNAATDARAALTAWAETSAQITRNKG